MNKRAIALISTLICFLLLTACSREYNTELMNAAKGGNETAVKGVLDRGANINEQSNKGKTALMFAAAEGHTDVAQLLIKHGAKIDTPDHYGTTALIIASTSGHSDIVALLLELDANLEARDTNGSAPLVNAVYFGHTEVVKLLLNKMATLKQQDGEELILLASGLGHTDIVDAMLANGISANSRGLKQRTALMAAAAFDKIDTIKLLLKNGADPGAKDEDGNTAYSVAKDRGNDDASNLLGSFLN